MKIILQGLIARTFGRYSGKGLFDVRKRVQNALLISQSSLRCLFAGHACFGSTASKIEHRNIKLAIRQCLHAAR